MKKWIALALGVMSLALIYDWPLALFFVSYQSHWAEVFKEFGHLPAFYVGLMSMLGYSNPLSFFKKAFLKSLVIAGSFVWILDLSQKIKLDVFFWGIILYLSLAFWVRVLNKQKKERIQAWFKLSTLIFLVAFLGPNLIKLFVLRFRPSLYFPGCMTYSFYIKPIVFNLEYLHQSFPSGHSALAMSLLTLAFLAPHSSLKRKLFSGLILGFVLMMGLSRMVLGDHFASDVLLSLLTMGFLIETLRHKIFTKFD